MMRLSTPIVRRVHDGNSSWIEPACDDFANDDANRLAWKAAVVALETGLPIEVYVDDGGYGLIVGRLSSSPRSFRDAWVYLCGVETGVRALRMT